MPKNIRLAMLILVGLLLITIWNSFFILPEGVQAVVTQFGAPVGNPVVKAGPHFKKPFVQDVSYFDKKILIWDGDPNQIPTKDKTFIYVDVTARWRIANALTFMQAVKNETRAQTILDDVIDSTVRDIVNKNDLVDIIRSSGWQPSAKDKAQGDDKPITTGRDKLAETIHQIASQATVQYGIEVVDVMFKRVNYIASVQNKVYERMISERKRIAAEKRSLGEGQKAEILGTVDRELRTITSSAQKKAEEIKGKADAEAAKIYAAAYNQDPNFYDFYQTLESYQQTIGANTRMVISTDSEFYRYLVQLK